MKITLVNAPVKAVSAHARLSPPLGLAYIAAVLLRAGHEVEAVDFNISGLNMRRVDRIVRYDMPDLVGISAMTETYPNALAIARRLRELNPRIVIVMGGAHPSIFPTQVLKEAPVDYVVVGPGEAAITRIVDHLERREGSLEDIPGLGYRRDDGDVAINARAPLADPDDLPIPAREIFPMELYSHAVNVLTATGSCPYKCPFCSAASIWEGRRRTRSPESILHEVRVLVDDYGIDHLFFNDDIFTLNKRWVYRLLEALGTLQTPIAWECATRVDLVDRNLLKAMADVGCVGVQFGVESGAQEILDSVKSVSKQQAMAAVDAAVAVGIRPLCSFMVPFPEDTPETLQETGDFMGALRDLGADILLSYTAPYPGTYFYSHADELGLRILTDCWDEFDAKHVVMETRNLSAGQIRAAVEGIAERLRMSWSTDWEGSGSAEVSREGQTR